jgi:branched-chain amino acid transport system substrate-binding protein
MVRHCRLAAAVFAGSLAVCTAAAAEPGGGVKIGLITDFNSVYSDIGGQGNLEAAKMAIEDFHGEVLGKPIDIISADVQNKADVAAALARKWYENEGVDMIVDMPTSATALAAMEMSKAYEKILIVTDAASSDITGKSCSPYTAHWTYDTYSNAHTVGSAIVKQGGDTWFFITADYLFGHSIERDTGEVVKAAGGKVLGSVKHPLNTADFSSFLLQAQNSKAKIIGLANGGGDTINAIKQASEFGIVAAGQNLAGIVMFISDIHSLGLKLAQGLIITEAYYWDQNERTRAFGKRFFERMKRMPTMNQAATYSATLHYLKAVQAAGTKETKAVYAKMHEMPVRDAFTDNGTLREDGRMVHSMLLLQVKKPEESKAPWDYYKLIQTVPGDQAFRPIDKGDCPLVKKG